MAAPKIVHSSRATDDDVSSADESVDTNNAIEEPDKQIRCVSLTGFGGLKNLKLITQAELNPGEGELLIRVKACGLNFNDLMMRQGALEGSPKPPFTMGQELSGIVENIGPKVERFKVGDRVMALCESGAWADQAVVSAKFVYHVPDNMTFDVAAAFLVSYVSAYVLLFDVACVRSGQSVLVHSVAGALGHAICQISRSMENVTLYGTTSDVDGKKDAVRGNVEHLYDRSSDFSAEIRQKSPEGVDVVLDCLCGEETVRGLALLKPLGRYVLYGSGNFVSGDSRSFFSFAKSWWQIDKVSPVRLFEENKSMGGFSLRQLLFRQDGDAYVRGVVLRLLELYHHKLVQPVIDSSWAFDDVADGMQRMHERKNIGKIVIDPAKAPLPKPEPPLSKLSLGLMSLQRSRSESVDKVAAAEKAALQVDEKPAVAVK